MNPDLDFLKVIRLAALAVVRHAGDHDRISFEADRMSRSAVLYEIVAMGEGVKRLWLEFRAAYPDIPWNQIAGTRDRVVHSFDEVDLDMIWNVITTHAPILVTALDDIMVQESNS